MLSEQMQQIITMLKQNKAATEGVVYTPEIVLQARAGADQMMGSLPLPETMKCESVKLGSIDADYYEYLGDRPADNGKIGMFIHGGGFMTGSKASRRYMAVTVLNYAGMNGYSIEYTQYPEGKHPQGLLDCIEAFHEIQKLGYKAEDIYIYGESGGAMLCLMMTMYLKDHGEALPGKICVFSPLINIKDEYPSRKANDERDPMIHGNVNHELDPYFTEEDKASRYVSTAFGDFTGFPPVLIFAGSEEVLYDDAVDLEKRCREAGVDVTLKIWEGLFHSFAILPAPESEEALKEIAEFFVKPLTETLFTTEKVSDSITRINVPGAVCVYYLEGNERGLLIDTGYGYGDLKGFVDSISTKPYDVALTHGHVDHAGGAAQFDKVYMNLKDTAVCERHTELTFRTNYIRTGGVDAKEEDMIPTRPVDTYTDLPDNTVFDLGGLHAKFVPLPGHTPGSMVVYIPEEKTMFFGDAVNSAMFLQLPESDSVAVYRNTLQAFEDEYAGTYEKTLFSHPHNFGGTTLVQEMIELCDQIVANPDMGFEMETGWPDSILALPINEMLRRLDGKAANLVFRRVNVK